MTWSTDVFSRCDFGDKRLTNRLIKMGNDLASKVGSHLSSCFEGKNSDIIAAYRFIRNKSVSPASIIDGVCASVAERSKSSQCLLAIEDTTSLNYTHSVKEELGYLSNTNAPGSAKGFFVHTVILHDPEKAQTLGMIDQKRWVRHSDGYGKHRNRQSREYKEKESFKWEEASVNVSARMGEELKKVISVCDREADIFEYLAYKSKENQRFIVRAAQDRLIYDEGGVSISEVVMSSKELGHFKVTVDQKGGRKAREVEMELRACRTNIAAPKNAKTVDEDSLEVNVISVTEISPPSGQKALSWVLLTSEFVNDFEQAQKIVRYYEKRWLIEEFHKCWKSGVNVEKLRMQFSDNLERMITVLSPIAIRLLQLRENLDQNGNDKSCLEVLSDDEFFVLWRSVEKKKRIPRKKPSLNWAYRAIAKLSGWHDSKKTGKACWSKLWEGWYLLSQRLEGYLLSKEVA